MVIQSVNWDRYKSVANLSKCDSGIKLYLDTTLSPIIHALHTQDNKIYFHEGMEVHLLLMNLARISPSIFLKIAVFYELVSILVEYRYLDSAQYILEKLKEEIGVLNNVGEMAGDFIDLDIQFEFFIGHEYSHYLYGNNSILREEATNEIKELINLYSKPKNLMQLIFYPKIKRMLEDKFFIEELSCDRNSIIYFIREIPKSKMIKTIHQITQLLYMLQLHKDLEELMKFSLSKGLSKHLTRFYFDVIRAANIAQSIIQKNKQILDDSQIDGNVIKKAIQEDSLFYNNINNKLMSLWNSDNYLYVSMMNNQSDYSNQSKYEDICVQFQDVSKDILNKAIIRKH